jgi:hypothetical protein
MPKAVRDELNLQPGNTPDFASEAERLTLRLSRPHSRRKHGGWVFRTGQHISAASTDEALLDIREQRGRNINVPTAT